MTVVVSAVLTGLMVFALLMTFGGMAIASAVGFIEAKGWEAVGRTFGLVFGSGLFLIFAGFVGAAIQKLDDR